MKKSIKIFAIVVVLGGMVFWVATKLKSNQKEVIDKVYHPDINLKAVVQAEIVKDTLFVESTSFTGSFEPNREVNIASETSGKVITVGVEEGDKVVAGSLIAQLGNGILQAQLRAATATLENAKATLKRYEAAPSGVTPLQMDNARVQVVSSQSQIDLLNNQIAQYTIKAPFSGVITSTRFDLGAIVSPGVVMATLIDISTLDLEINIPEKFLNQFSKGDRVKVTSDVSPSLINGKITYISSIADAAHNYKVKIAVPNGGKSMLKAGMYGSVAVDNSSTSKGISIPRTALIGNSLQPQVYVVIDETAVLKVVKIGATNATHLQIVEGLKEGDVVVTGGLVNLTNGVKVEVKL